MQALIDSKKQKQSHGNEEKSTVDVRAINQMKQ